MTDFSSRYDPKRLLIGSYGAIFYLPKVDLLSQLSLDLDTLKQKHKEMGEQRSRERKRRKEQGQSAKGAQFEYFDYKIKVPVPPPPGEAMVNPRTKERFPMGTRTDPGTGEELQEIESVLEERSIRNQIIFTDIDHGTVYYVDSAGALATHNIGHTQHITENSNAVLASLDKKVNPPSRFTSISGMEHKWDKANLERLFYVDPEDNSPQAKAHRERLQSMSNVDFTKEGGIPLFMYSRNKDFKLWVESELLKIESKISRGVLPVKGRRGSPNTQLGDYYASLIAAVLFAGKHSEYFADLISQEEEVSDVDPSQAPKVPHIKEDTRFLPHQAYALSFLKDKKAAMVDADPGAGKTLMMLADVMDKLNRGLARRPCIVMPNTLLSQQKRELEEWTKGTVNFVVINTDTVKQMDPENVSDATGLPKRTGGNPNKGLQEIKKLLQEAPPNTVLLTSYAWIRGGSEDQVQTGSGITFRRASWLVTWAGVDMLVLDESHNVRIGSSGKESKKAQAIMQMARLVRYKRCYTGTSAPSGPDDVFLQMNFLDPSVLGDRKSFLEKYGASKSEGKRKRNRIEMFKPGAIKEIRSLISRRTGLSIRRSAWLSELPQLDVKYHKALLTVPQRVVYERIMERIIKEELGDLDPGSVGLELQSQMRDEYASNPTARAQLDQWHAPDVVSITEYDEDEDEMVEVEYDLRDQAKKKAFKAALQRAKKSWDKYQQMDDVVGEEDFLPLLQKFIAIDRFLNNPASDDFGQHFLFDEVDRTSPKVKVIDKLLAEHFANPSNGKVIIFTQYKDVAGHILEHMQMSGSAVYYDSAHPKNLESFKKDDEVKILIAVEQSIREGQNLQMANRIIRVDLPWNPGDYEQAIARAYRLPPKDPNAARYSVVHVDLILTEGTAEITKFMRMVSKLHKVRQLISGFTAERQFPLVGMNLDNMQRLNKFEDMAVYQDVYARIREQEIEEAKQAPDTFGTESYELSTGEQLEGSEQIETPFVPSDEDLNPYVIDPTKYASKLLRPTFVYFNSAFWIALKFDPQMKRVLYGFPTAYNSEFLYHGFSSAAEAIDILKALQSNEQAPLRVVNAQELLPKIFGRVPVDPSFPGSVINYNQLVKNAATAPSDFRPTNQKYSRDILAYQPSQQDRQVTLSLLQLAARQAGGKPVTPLHALAAAKLFGFFNLDAADLDPKWLWKNSRHFAMIRGHKDILQQQLEQQAQAPAAPEGQEVTHEPEDNEIPGLDAPITAEGIPIELQVSILGAITEDSVVQRPCFTISDTAGFTVPGLADKVVAALRDHGFKQWQSAQTWLYMGETRNEAASSIKKFAKRLYLWKYYLEEPDHFEAQINKFGLSMDDIWPKQEMQAMRRIAQIWDQFPEYHSIVADVFDLDQ